MGIYSIYRVAREWLPRDEQRQENETAKTRECVRYH